MKIQSSTQWYNKKPRFTSGLSSRITRAEINKLKDTLDVIEKHYKEGDVYLLSSMGIFAIALWATFRAMKNANKR